jgi:tripartite-type tricarboxylate transporter receptor subunit TctC
LKHLGRILAFSILLNGAGVAQAEPAMAPGTINIVVPLAAGGPIDIVARIVSQSVSKSLRRDIVVTNKGGAGGNIGASMVARAKPDGLTWLLTFDTVLTVNPHLYADMGFNPDQDLVAVAAIAHSALVLAVNARKVGAANLAELIETSRTVPVSFASAGVGTPAHLAFEHLRMVSGLRGIHVPYRGAAPALQDIVAGAVDAGFLGIAPVIPLIESGALRALTVSTESRLSMLPKIPSAAEAGLAGFNAKFAFLLVTQPKVATAVQGHFKDAVKAAMDDPEVGRLLRKLAIEPEFTDGPTVSNWIASERRKWGKVVAAARLN